MSQIIDRRNNNSKKNLVNRQRFLRRYKNQIKRAVSDAINKRSITDIDKGEKINIPAKDIAEPVFNFSHSGHIERIFPGNDKFIVGDRILRPSANNSNDDGSQASDSGEGEDQFIFEISREEFIELYFEDLELPDLVQKDLANMQLYKTIRAGITTSGMPTNINIVRSMRQAAARRIALMAPYKKKLHQTEAELLKLQTDPNASIQDIAVIQENILRLQKRIQSLPFIDTIDLRYNYHVHIPLPSTQAVMFCIMDVSGSMDAIKKDIAKRFFILLYLFLTKNYTTIELVFIRHHASAKEVNEHDFFYSRETGGTVVSSALELLQTIITTRYPVTAWNIYVAQASDGDNWNADSPYCQEILQKSLIDLVQYFAYIEIMPRQHQSLWEVYKLVQKNHANFAMESIESANDIYSVFRELFKRKSM